jgi:hypothetical protein
MNCTHTSRVSSLEWRLSLWRLTALLLAIITVACTTAAQPRHAFDFRPLTDSPNVKVLDWRYGDLGPKQWEIKRALDGTEGLAGTRIVGPIPVADQLYVRWQVPPHTQVLERTISLRGKLPPSMNGKQIVLLFRAGEPRVYIVTTDKRPCEGANCVAYLASDVTPHARSFMYGRIQQLYP